jgi:hypothetical protein
MLAKWLKLSEMAEINHSNFRNFLAPETFKYIEAGGRRKTEKADDQPGQRCSGITWKIDSFEDQAYLDQGGEYALRKVFGDVGSDDGSDGLFAGAGKRWSGRRRRAGLCGWTSGVRLWLLRLCALRLRSVWLLRA